MVPEETQRSRLLQTIHLAAESLIISQMRPDANSG